MRSHKVWPLVAAGFLLAAAACGEDSRIIGEDRLPASLQQKVEALEADLEAQGFEVLRGDWSLFTIDDCQFPIATLGQCLGNNPAAPYAIPSVPLWPDEHVDETLREVLGPMPGDTWVTHRLDEREALVVLALTPPQGAYYGLQTYVFSREDELNPNDPVFLGLTDPIMRSVLFATAPDPARVLVFASLGNSNNHVVVQQASGAAFDQQRFFVITPDQVMERAVTESLLRAGVPDPDHILTEPISAEQARLGLGAGADDFMTLMRYALPADPDAGERWRQRLPMAVLRVRDPDATRATEPYPTPVLDARTAISEAGLADDVAQLVGGVRQIWGQAAAPATEFESLLLSVDLVGRDCLERPMNCLGDTGDADYQISPTVTLDDGEVLAVVGTLGTATGNATYVSLSINRIEVLMGVANVDHDELQGSAGGFADDVAGAGQLYLQYFARDCGALAHCFEIGEDLVPAGEAIKIIQRNYVVPGTARGPDPLQVVNPTLIVLDGAVRPTPPDGGGPLN